MKTDGTHSQAWQAGDRVDPYWRVALALDGADHDVPVSGIGLTFELMPGQTVSALQQQLDVNDRVRSHWQGEQAVFGTAWLSLATARRWEAQGPPACMARFEVGMPWRDQRQPAATVAAAIDPLPIRPPSARQPTHTLCVVIDHGCPFAHPALRRPDGQTCIDHLWDQESQPELGDRARQPQPWGYGGDLDRADMMQLLQAANGDEAACYARMGYHPMQRRAVHGAHVLGQMVSSAWDDVVFVQLPRAQLQTLSRSALAPYVLDGAMYALALAAPGGRVIVNLSLEAYDGPHDAHSLWSQALQALTWHARVVYQIEWTWVVAAGNSAALKVNTTLSLQAHRPESFIWRVPPASEHVAWLELWWPASMGALSLWLTAPGQNISQPLVPGALTAWPSLRRAASVVAYSKAVTACGYSVLIRLAPTDTGRLNRAVAPAGDWAVHLLSEVPGTVRAYLARVWQGGGGHRRGVQGQLWPACHHPTPEHDLERHDESPRADSLNGLAAEVDSVVVAQAMRWRLGQLEETDYSGRGRAQTVSAHLCEESSLLHGVRSWGALGGQSVRMNGTSVAVPQAVRALATAKRRAPP